MLCDRLLNDGIKKPLKVSHNSVRSYMSEMSYDSDMFESSHQPKRQPGNIGGVSPRKSILKPKKMLEEILLEE